MKKEKEPFLIYASPAILAIAVPLPLPMSSAIIPPIAPPTAAPISDVLPLILTGTMSIIIPVSVFKTI